MHLPFWCKSTPSIYLLLKIASFFKTIITYFYPFLSSRWFKIKCSFIDENNISPVSILISLAPFYSFFLYFFIYFWCKLRRDIKVTIFFQNIIYCSVLRNSREFFLKDACYLLNTDKLIFSGQINNFSDRFLNQTFYSFLSLFSFQNFNFRSDFFLGNIGLTSKRNLLTFLYQFYILNILYQ